MRVQLPATKHERANARQWFVALSMPFRQRLDDTIKALEHDLGPCDAYIEVAMRLPGGFQHVRHNQIDLLLCFQQAVAICEIKGINHSKKQTTVDKAVEQVRDYVDLARAHARAQTGIYPFVFFPELGQNGLTNVAERLMHSSQHHIRAVGALDELAGKRTSRGHALYLPEALDQLKDRPRLERADPGTSGIRSAVEQTSGKMSDFDSMQQLGDFLATVQPSFVTHLSWHLPDLRTDECARAIKILKDYGVVEIVGAPGIGKSSLAKDIIERWLNDHQDYHYEQVKLSDCINSLAIRSALLAQMDGYAPAAENVQRAFSLLLDQPLVIWIDQRHQVPDAALCELLLEISDTRPPSQVRWIIESHNAVLERNVRVELSGLSRMDINRVLDGVPAVADPSNRELILERAGGNPRRAIILWRSESPEKDATLREGTLSWFLGRTSVVERELLEAMAYLLSITPVGLPIESIRSWVLKVMPTLPPVDVRDALTSVLTKLEEAQLANIERVDTLSLGSIVADDGTDIGDLLFWMDENLILKLLRSGDGSSLYDQAEEHLYDTVSRDDAIAVTLTLNLDEPDLGPFLRSTFRRTHLHRVMPWLERRGVVKKIGLRKEQAFAYRCLALLKKTFSAERPTKEELDECVAGMPAGSEMARLAATVTEGVLLGLDRAASRQSVEEWAQRCAAEPILDLRCEMQVRLAAVLAGQGRHVESWEALKNCLATAGVGDGARALALTYALGDLNRLKLQIDGFPSETERRDLIEEFARELFELGVRNGNYAVCGDAVYYYVRTAEYDLARAKNLDENKVNQLLSMLPALEFVERVSMTRVTQALLTQGSIHRHVARWQDVEFDRFWSHATAAMRLYKRALSRALARKHVTFALNAVSSMIDVCIRLLRFEAIPTSAADFLAYVRSALEAADRISAAFRRDAMVQYDSALDLQNTWVRPILDYIIAIHDNEPEKAKKALIAAVMNMDSVVQDRGRKYGDRAQQVGRLIRNVNRAVRFLSQTGHLARPAGVERVSPPWQSRLRETAAFVGRSSDKKLRRELEQFVALLNGTGKAELQ